MSYFFLLQAISMIWKCTDIVEVEPYFFQITVL